MAMFQGILPPNAQPEQATLPPGLLALLPQGGATAAMGRNLAATQPFGPGAGQQYAPGQQPLPSSVPGASNAPPVAPRSAAAPMSAPLIGGPPMLNPMDAAMAAASEGASKAQVYDSPLATLASSLLAGIASGASAFKAQKQVNAEAKYKNDVEAAKEASWQSFVNDEKNFPDANGKALQASLKGMDRATGQKLMGDVGMWKPDLVAFGKGGLMDGRTREVLKQPAGEVYKKNDAVQATDLQGNPLTNADGSPRMVYPAGREAPIDRSSPVFLEKLGALYGPEAMANPTQEQMAGADAALQKGKIEVANAGRASAGDLSGAAFANVAATRLGPLTDAINARKAALPDLQKAYALLKEGNINTGPFSGILDAWNKLTDKERAVNGEKYTAQMMATIFPTLRATLGAQFTEREGQMLLQAGGANRKMFLPTLLTLVGDKIASFEPARIEHNNRVATTMAQHPETIGMYLVDPLASAPSSTESLPTEAPANPKKGDAWKDKSGVVQVWSPSKKAWMPDPTGGQ